MFAVALFVVASLVPFVRDLALRLGAVQRGGSRHGSGERRHVGAVPSSGGIAIVAGVLVALAVGVPFAWSSIEPQAGALVAIVLGGLVMALVGTIDDVFDLPVSMRLAAQAVAAGILVLHGVTIDFVTNYFAAGPLARFVGDGNFVFFGETLSVAITLVWIVGFTNAFNFIDGVDGLSSGVAAIGSLCLMVVAFHAGGGAVAIAVLAALAGASVGFLRHNAGPATIFMGDAGSLFLGYVLAAVSVVGALKVTATVTLFVPLLILGLPVVNITQVTVRRLRRGVHPATASNDHLHDLLRARGRSDFGTVLVLWSITLGLGVVGMALAATPVAALAGTVVAVVVAIGGASWVRRLEAARTPVHVTDVVGVERPGEPHVP